MQSELATTMNRDMFGAASSSIVLIYVSMLLLLVFFLGFVRGLIFSCLFLLCTPLLLLQLQNTLKTVPMKHSHLFPGCAP